MVDSRNLWLLRQPDLSLYTLSIPQEWMLVAAGLIGRTVSMYAVWMGGRVFACEWIAPD